jgi:hypothetical protein
MKKKSIRSCFVRITFGCTYTVIGSIFEHRQLIAMYFQIDHLIEVLLKSNRFSQHYPLL